MRPDVMWQREVIHHRQPGSPPPRLVRAAHATRAERIILAAGGIGVLLIMASYGLVRLVARTSETLAGVGDGVGLDGIPWGPVVVVGALLLLRVAFRAGQYHRGFTHAKGIWHSHRSAIGGGHK